MSIQRISRRDFLKSTGLAGSSLVFGISLSANPTDSSDGKAFSPDVFVSIDGEGEVTIVCHRSEMGQGIRSTAPLLIADELEADAKRMKVKQAIADARYGSQNTDGSRSIRRFYTRFQQAGALTRTMLQNAAAQIWQVDAAKVRIFNHEALLEGTNKRLDFKDLVAVAATLKVPELSTLKLKSIDEQRYVGKDGIEILDAPDMVQGKAIYGVDVQLENMHIAVIARPPVVFGKVKSYDATETLKVPGVVKVLQLPDLNPPAVFRMLGGIAVIATNTWAAMKGREKLKIEWDHGVNQRYDTKAYEAEFEKALIDPPNVIRKRGDWGKAKNEAEQLVEAGYHVGGLAHATMEPPAATARITGDQVEIWACTQTPQSAQRNVMAVLGMKPEERDKVIVNVTLLGGGFGRKSKPDFVAEAAYLAKQTELPIKVIWTREDDMKHGYYHSPSYQRLAASFDNKGQFSGWYHGMVNHAIGSTFNPDNKAAGIADLGMTDMPFDVPNIQIMTGNSETSLRIGWVRSVTNINNAFAIGCFMDECAYALKMDPLTFWLKAIGEDKQLDFSLDGVKYDNYGESLDDHPVDTGRLKNVLKVAAEAAGLGRELPEGHGIGISAHRSFCAYVASAIEVSVKDGRLKIERIHNAIDAGHVLNPDRVRSQMEGASIFATTFAFYGEITAKEGQVEQGNFDDYQLARIHQFPKEIHTHIVPSRAAPAGVGEPGVPPFAPALCNAIFAATGKRIRRLPLIHSGLV